MRALLAALLLIIGFAHAANAVQPSEMLKDPVQESRAQEIGRQLRCPVCKTESIEESNADLTAELRHIVRERVVAGDTNQQVLDYLHARYGDFILLNPRFQPTTWALWLAPPVILILGGTLAYAVIRRRRAADEPEGLSEEERHAIEALR